MTDEITFTGDEITDLTIPEAVVREKLEDGDDSTDDSTGDDTGGDGEDGMSGIDLSDWRIIDVTTRGVDSNGETDLAEYVRDANWSGGRFLFVLPEGSYKWGRELLFNGNDGEYDEPIPECIGFIGKPHAVFDVDMRPNCTDEPNIFRFGTHREGVPKVILKNITFDIGDADAHRDAGIMRAYITDRMETKNLSLTKRQRIAEDGTDNGDRHTFLTCCIEEDAVAVHEDVDLLAGDVHRPGEESVGHAIGFAAEPPHVGTTYYNNCKIAGYTDNGFYVRDGPGKNILEGCMARNCGGGHIRLGFHDHARNCKVIVDGTEEPANGAAVWIQEAKGTRAEGIRVIAPEMANDVFRTTGEQNGGAIRDCYVELGDTGEYVWKARGKGPAASFDYANNTVHDECTGWTREASYSIAQENVTMRNISHHGPGQRIPFAFRAKGTVVKNSDIEVNGMVLARLGSVNADGEEAHVRMKDNTIVDPGSYQYAFKAYRSPNLRWLVLEDNDFSDANYSQAIANATFDDFDVGDLNRCEGL